MEAFVYRWRNTETGMWYIGFHKGTPDDGYICSSKIAKPLIKSNPKQWVRKILQFGTKKDMTALERKLLKKLNARHNPRSYNQSNATVFVKSLKEHLGYDLNTMTAEQVMKHYKQEIEQGNRQRRLLVEEWLFNKVCR